VADVEPEEGELSVSFDGRSVTYGFGELDALVPAYAVSTHKSQGSEYPAVVIPVMTQHYAMLQRNRGLFITGSSFDCPSSNGLGQSELFRDGGSGSFGLEFRRLSTDVAIVAV
jgi:hypothetical protein